MLGPDAQELSAGPPIWKYIPTPGYKRFDKASIEIYQICEKLTKDAVERLEKSGKTNIEEMSVLEKMIRRAGPDSQIPSVMALAAIAGASIQPAAPPHTSSMTWQQILSSRRSSSRKCWR